MLTRACLRTMWVERVGAPLETKASESCMFCTSSRCEARFCMSSHSGITPHWSNGDSDLWPTPSYAQRFGACERETGLANGRSTSAIISPHSVGQRKSIMNSDSPKACSTRFQLSPRFLDTPPISNPTQPPSPPQSLFPDPHPSTAIPQTCDSTPHSHAPSTCSHTHLHQGSSSHNTAP